MCKTIDRDRSSVRWLADSPVRRFVTKRLGETVLFALFGLILGGAGYKSAWQNNSAVKDYGFAAKAEAAGNSQAAATAYKEALDGFWDATIADPESAQLKFNLGSAYYKNGETQAAVENFERAAVEESLRSDAYYNLGNSQLAAGNAAAAVKAYKDALRLDPDREDTWHNLAAAIRLLEMQQQQQQQQCESKDGRDGESAKGQKGGQEEKEQQQAAGGEKGEEKTAEKRQAKEGEMSEEGKFVVSSFEFVE